MSPDHNEPPAKHELAFPGGPYVSVSARAIAVLLAGLGLVLGAVLVVARQAGLTFAESNALVVSLATLALILLPLPVLLSEHRVDRLRKWVDGRRSRALGLAALPLAPFILYWAVPGNATPIGVARLALYVMVPTALAILLPLGRGRAFGDALVVATIWLPVELKEFRASFPWPPGGSGYLLVAPLAMDLLLYLMLVVRRFDGSGLRMRLRARDVAIAAGAFVSFAAVGVPIGLKTGFLSLGFRAEGVVSVLAGAAVTFLFTALPEEILFRGMVQGILQNCLGRPRLALGIASLIFGAAHLNNGPNAPDWRYFVLATLAGIAYGWVYQRTRRISASALTHALVDVTWTIFLKG